MADVPRKQRRKYVSREELESLSKEELVSRVLKLEAHNEQLRNTLAKRLVCTEGSSSPATQECSKSGKGRAFNFSHCSKRHVLLRFLYLGWDYQGLATQEDTTKTIEHELFSALYKACLVESRQSANYHRCGRTDKGVSAFSQAISLDVRSVLTQEQLDAGVISGELPYPKLLNRLLPDDIRIISWIPVPTDFSARFDCKGRTYKYFFPRGNLNIEAMDSAVKMIIGTFDFRNLCKMDVKNGVTNYMREVLDARVDVMYHDSLKDAAFDMCELTLRGRAFLWHQVRCIMGVLLLVGQGRECPSVLKTLLNVEDLPCKPQYNLASELPLNLFGCDYDSFDGEVRDTGTLEDVICGLQRAWAECTVKASMMRAMLAQLQSAPTPTPVSQSDWLLQGVRAKIYRPLLDRPTCESLENRVQHYTKKQKMNYPLQGVI